MRVLLCLLTFLLVSIRSDGAPPVEDAPKIEFLGVACDPDCRFLFRVDGAETAWVVRGGVVAPGHRVIEYFEAKRSGVVLDAAGRLLYIPLISSMHPATATNNRPTPKKLIVGSLSFSTGRGQDEVFDVKLEIGTTSTFPLDQGRVFVITPTMTPEGNVKYSSEVQGDNDANSFKNPDLIAPEGEGFSLVVNDVGVNFSKGAGDKK